MNPRATDGTRSTRRHGALTEREVAEQLGTVSRDASRVETSRQGTAVPAAWTLGAVPALGRGRLRPGECS